MRGGRSIEGRGSLGLINREHGGYHGSLRASCFRESFRVTSVKVASVEASVKIASVGAPMEVSVEIASVEGFMEASVEVVSV